MSKLNPPKELCFDGNLSQNWERWKKEFQFYMTATESNDKGEDVKTSRLLTAIGERAREIYYTFTFAEAADSMKLEPVIAKFDEYMNPKKNIPYLRFKFFSYNQSEGQSIDDYVTELKLKLSLRIWNAKGEPGQRQDRHGSEREESSGKIATGARTNIRQSHKHLPSC